MNVTTLLRACAFLLIAQIAVLSAQTPAPGDPEKLDLLPTTQGVNSEGTHFVVGFMKNEESTSICAEVYPRYSRQNIMLASRFATQVTVTYPNGSVQSITLAPFRIRSLSLNDEQYECLEEICTKSFTITSAEPISVYCFSSKTHTSDGYLALPVSSWGTEYVTANYFVDHYSDTSIVPDECMIHPRGGEFAIISAEDGTEVTVTTTADTRSNQRAGVPITRRMAKGEIWMIEDGGTVRGGSDITGSTIRSTKPVGVLSGHVRTGVQYWFDSKDHLIEMLPPVKDFGKRHILVPFGGRGGGDLVRVISSVPGQTDITFYSSMTTLSYPSLQGVGDYREINIRANEVSVITTTEPVLVAHYSKSNGADISSLFDPDMVVVTPEEQFANSAIFQTMPNGSGGSGNLQFDQHYVTIVGEKEKFETLRINDQPLSTFPGVVAKDVVPTLEDEFVWLTARLPGNAAFVIQGEAKFGGYVYGLGEFDSYAWPVGAGNAYNPLDTTRPELTGEPECGELYYDVTATDSMPGLDFGLRNLYLDASASTNVRFVSLTPPTWTDPIKEATLRLTLIDPTQPGHARVVAVDAGGKDITMPNRDTLEIDMRTVAPTFSRDSVLIADALINLLRREGVTITNTEATRGFTIDSVALVHGRQFRITGLDRGGPIDQYLLPGEEFDLGIEFVTGTLGSYDDTLVVWVDCRPYRIPLTALMPVPRIETEDKDFGELRKGTSRCLEVRVRNSGEGILQIYNVVIDGVNLAFRLQNGSVPDLPLSLGPGEDTIVIICFDPTTVGAFTGEVLFNSNAFGGDSTGALTGRSIYPQLLIEGWDFGAVQIGDTACDRVPIVNTGTDTAYLTGVTLPESHFTADESVFPYALPPGDTLWVPVCFVPTAESVSTSLIGADNSDGLEAVSRLDGSGYQLLAEIDGYDWGVRWVGTQHDTIVHIRNLTDRAIRIDSIWLADGDNGDFTILTQIPPSATIAPNDRHAVAVRFAPLSTGKRIISIRALTSSRQQPIIENVLEGYGIQPIPGDELAHDSALFYACDMRQSRIFLYNRGNTILTLAHISVDDPLGLATVNLPPVGAQIPVGDDPLEVDVAYLPNGFAGSATVSVRWGFVEVPDEEFSRSMTFTTETQSYTIVGVAPPQVDNGENFDLFVGVEELPWPDVAHGEVRLSIAYNPTVSYFDEERWYQIVGLPVAGWTFVGAPVYLDKGHVQLTLRPVNGGTLPIGGLAFPGIPFRGFLGNAPLDTFAITMDLESDGCITGAATTLPYSIADICGLNMRLFEYAGEAPKLSHSRPNPASSVMEFDYTIPFEGHVRIALYTPDGSLVAPVVDGVVGGGDHAVRFDLDRIANGVYYYRLDYGTYTATRAIVVQK